MKSEMFSLTRYIFCLLDIFMLYRFFGAMFELRVGKKKAVLYFVFAVLSMFVENMYGNTVVNLAVSPIISILFVWVVYNASLINKTIYIQLKHKML